MNDALKVGDRAPNLQGGNPLGNALEQARRTRKYAVLYFYPKDNTPGCTAEACSFRDNMARLLTLGSVVIGVSPDSSASHDGFKEEHDLNFMLIADEHKGLCREFDVLRSKEEFGKTIQKIERTTFIIDPNGRIVWLERPVQVEGHVDRIMEALHKLKSH